MGMIIVLMKTWKHTRETIVYKLDLNADVNLTTCKAEFKATFPQMIEKFGEGYKGGYKTSMEWSFIDDNDEVFTVYDWKSTSLYADNYPAPEVLWGSDELYGFHVGARGCANDFIDWISSVLGGLSKEEKVARIEETVQQNLNNPEFVNWLYGALGLECRG
jgi:hypothetical protein